MKTISKILTVLAVIFFSGFLSAQTTFPYQLMLEPLTIDGLDGLHSYAFGQYDGKWLLIGGRRDGIHARQPFNAFPASQNNKTIYVVDPVAGSVWTASVEGLPVGLKEQLQSTNMQFFQEEDFLYIVGGYGYSSTTGDHITYPNLTALDVPGLIEDIIYEEPVAENFRQINDDNFAVTGGYMGKVGDEFLLVGGHRFDGRYNPMNMPTFEQTYTNEIRKFTVENTGNELTYGNYAVIADPVNFHRRDYNLLPQIFPDGEFGYTMFAGVFQYNQDLPFLFPVDIRTDGHVPVNDFNQYLCNYHAANVALYDAQNNSMHNLFFGGISQYYYDGDVLVQDDNVPFVKTISRVSRMAGGTLEEVRLPVEMPSLQGASAEFIPRPDLPEAAPDIIDLKALAADTNLLGYIFGGIESEQLNPFTFNNSEVTIASDVLYKVYLIPENVNTAEETVLPGYHDFKITVFPNPNNSRKFQIKMEAPEAGTLEILMTNTSGRFILNETLQGLPEGVSQIELEMEEPEKGTHFITALLNGKHSASAIIVFH